MKTIVTLNFGERVVNLSIKIFDEEVDVDTILQIDYSNLVAEIITFPVIVNKFGLALADMDNKIAESKLNLDIFTAKTKEEIREYLSEMDDKGKIRKPTIDEIDNMLIQKKPYQIMKKQVFKAQKERDYINSIYWACKDKSTKLDKLSLTIQPGDIDTKMIQKSINGISIKFKENVFK